MKLITSLFLSLLLTTTARSQINQGQFLVGGNISFASTKNDVGNNTEYKTTNFFFSPDIGYFIISKLAAGIRADIRTYQQTESVTYKQTNVALVPFLRYYFLPANQKLNVLLDASYLHLSSKANGQGNTSRQKANGYAIAAGPAYFINEHVSLEFLLGYQRTKLKDQDSKTSIFNSSLGLQIHLGKIKGRLKK